MNLRVVFLAGLILTAVSGEVRAAAVINGGFEDPIINGSNIVVGAGTSQLTGWEVSGTSGIDLVRTYWSPSEGDQSISLNWTSGSKISQQIATSAGESYRVSFDMAAEIFGGPQWRTLNVLWNDDVIGSAAFEYVGQGPTNMGWLSFGFNVVGTGSDKLSFQSTTAFNYGPALDNVAIAPTAVPEPASIAMWGIGALGLVFARRKRQQLKLGA